ncbi:prominin-1-A-like isoform X1 [Tympanuchus pallidicinctus]|uniref:prominin-1-A-like isoform X1 n=1 Tax=Tympanuchus pallidicinctus TaxID=109042 RepID=UPI002287321B|nr:prominin-1-A-like isoform X1 [Tympanuchus pallidicinctus]
MELGNISQPVYGPGLEEPSSSMPGLLRMAHGFLHLVQPHSLPLELIADLTQTQGRVVTDEQKEELLRYELGFLVCIAIGLLFAVAVPLAGCCFCCCRCCGRCGGRMSQKQSGRMRSRRRALYSAVLLVSALLLAGDVCAFISNIRFSQSVSSAFPNINSTVHDLCSYLLSIPQQVSFIIDSSSVPLGSTNDSLQNIGPLLGGRITSSIRNCTDEALGSLQSLLGGDVPVILRMCGGHHGDTRAEGWAGGTCGVLGKASGEGCACPSLVWLERWHFGVYSWMSLAASPAMETLASTFGTINSTRWRLEELQGTYDGQLGTLRARIDSTLKRCGQPCSTTSSNGVAFVANYSTVPGVERQLEALWDVLDSGIEGDLEVISVLEQAPRKVQEQSQNVVTWTQEQLGYIRQEIRSMQDELPLQNVEETAGNLVNQTNAVLGDNQKTITDLDSIRWSVCALLCCMVLLVVLCNTCGLLLGPLGHKESTLPTQRGCLSNTGGNFFMAGVGFSFIFSWLLMLLVLLTFFLGGNIYMLVCESWSSQQLFQLVDTPGLIPSFNLSEVLGDESGTITFSQIYRECQQDAALWQTLRLDQRVSLDELLDISQYTGKISAAFQKLNITLTPISVLNESQRELLLNACHDAQPPSFTHTLQQLDQGVTAGSLQELATELEQLVGNASADVQRDLKADAAELRELDRELNHNFSGPLKTLKENIQLVQSQAAQLEAQTNSTLDKASATEEFLRREMGNIIKNETWAFLEELLDFFETYIAWAKSSLRMDVARCKPIAQSLDNVEAIACDHILDSMNTFWFSLGWCTVFLLPSIILAVRLAKFYRRMDINDDYRKEAVEIGPAFNLNKIPQPATSH